MAYALLMSSRQYFDAKDVREKRKAMEAQLGVCNMAAVTPPAALCRAGAVESYQDALHWAEYIRATKEKIDGIVISLANFGEERAAADAIRLSGLRVPVLVHAWSDDPLAGRRGDAYWGKLSLCAALRQQGTRYSLTDHHVSRPVDSAFAEDLARFKSICAVANGLPGLRMLMIGTRPSPFLSVRYSEALLGRLSVTVDTVDLLDLVERARKMQDSTSIVADIAAVESYISGLGEGLTAEEVRRTASLLHVIRTFISDRGCSAAALNCWSSLEQYYGVAPCMIMAMLSCSGVPVACEGDICGALSMSVLALADADFPCLADWNNNYGDSAEKAVLFHCGNWHPAIGLRDVTIGRKGGFLDENGKPLDYIGQSGFPEATPATLRGRLLPGDITYLRIMTDDISGAIRAYVGEAKVTDDPLPLYGQNGVIRVPGLETLMQYACNNGFVHHVAFGRVLAARALYEALEGYLGIQTYLHKGG